MHHMVDREWICSYVPLNKYFSNIDYLQSLSSNFDHTPVKLTTGRALKNNRVYPSSLNIKGMLELTLIETLNTFSDYLCPETNRELIEELKESWIDSRKIFNDLKLMLFIKDSISFDLLLDILTNKKLETVNIILACFSDIEFLCETQR